tara:strand:+ start:1066 stop:1254 length:189 start_codon:yes stop_codon:yes gene_type:complete
MKKLVKKVLIEEREGGKVKVYKRVYEEVPDKPAPKKPAPKKAAPKKVEEPKVEKTEEKKEEE